MTGAVAGRAALPVFVYGTLCHAPLRRVVLGDAATGDGRPDGSGQGVAGRVAGQAMQAGRSGVCATIDAGAGFVTGLLLDGLTDAQAARIAFYAAVLGQEPRACTVETGAGVVSAVLYAQDAGAGLWSLAGWEARFAPAAVAAAADVMGLSGQVPPGVLAQRYGQMLGRGAARVRAGAAGPVTLRRAQRADDVDPVAVALPYAHFFAVEEHDLRFRRFDGAHSPVVKRAAFVMGDAVTVLPYDPRRDVVLLVEQFRAGPHVRGDIACWSLEAIAGRIDPGEGPEDAARREAVEEAGLTLGALEPVAAYYPSPGAVSEFLYSYVALVDLPEGSAGVFGVAGEAEDIRGHLIGFAHLMALVASGEVNNAPLVLSALWLQRERARLRSG